MEPTAAHRGPPMAWTVAGTVEAAAAAYVEPNGSDAGKPATVARRPRRVAGGVQPNLADLDRLAEAFVPKTHHPATANLVGVVLNLGSARGMAPTQRGPRVGLDFSQQEPPQQTTLHLQHSPVRHSVAEERMGQLFCQPPLPGPPHWYWA